jgi:hypothetical protein
MFDRNSVNALRSLVEDLTRAKLVPPEGNEKLNWWYSERLERLWRLPGH